jgi:hypothetical protein
MAAIFSFDIDQGTTFFMTLQPKSAVGETINLAGYGVRGQIRKSYQSVNKTDFTTEITDSLNGIFNISLTAAQTSALKEGKNVYDIELFDTSGQVIRLMEGTLTVNPEVTR